MAAILNFAVKTKFYNQNDVRFGILMVDSYEKVPSYMILGHSDQKLFFRDAAGRHFEFGSLAKKPGIFARDMGAKSFLKGP